MGSRWVNHGPSWRYYRKEGRLTLVKWDELNSNINQSYIDKTKTNIWSIVNLKVKIKRKGFGTRLVMAAIRKAKKHKVFKLAVIPAETEEAIEFWKTFDIPANGGYINCKE